MAKIINFINKLSKPQKIICLVLAFVFVLFICVGIPTLARYKNRNIVTTSVWDGSIASSYHKGNGTEADPYVISNGSELAYFSSQLSTTDYDNTYFLLINDIILNTGIFRYDSDYGIQYILDDNTYYVDSYSNKYYDNINHEGTEVGTINIFNSLDNFKGKFDGNSFRIYGLYLTDENSDELALFTDLQGQVTNLYVENSIVYGGIITAGIASKTTDSSLTNVLFDGYVVGKSTELTRNTNTVLTSSIINVENTETTNDIDLTNNIPFIGSEIVSTSITGNYVINGSTASETSIKINGTTVTNGNFDINLGDSILSNISVVTSTTSEADVTVTFSNLSYNIVYKYAAAGGITAFTKNTIIENTINKANVYGYSTSGGLVGVSIDSLNISQSYNIGDINSEYVSGGLIGTIEKSSNDINIFKAYNTGNMSASNIGGLIGFINNNSGVISLNNVFNTSSTNYSIGTIFNTDVNVSNAYFVNGEAVNSGSVNGNFIAVSMSNLQSKSYIVNNLSFYEFVNFDDLTINNQNAWVYEDNALPILFIDDISNPIANVNVSVYSWNNLSHELSKIRLDSNITFSIETVDELNPVKEKYYYVSNRIEPLTNEEISQIDSWTSYNGIEQITEEGYYIIYVKVVDYDDNITYLNTDLLVLDLPGVSASIKIEDSAWSDLRNDLDSVYIDRQKSVIIDIIDTISEVSSTKYYITDEILNNNDLDELEESKWITYNNEISISDIGIHIVYVRIIDNFDDVTYINTDYIVLNGYTQKDLTIGRNSSSYNGADPYITNKSTISFNTSYTQSSANPLVNYTHNLMSNILLPLDSKLTLIDHITSKVYEYQITTNNDIYNYNNSCNSEDLECVKVATYPFTLFKEVGTGETPKLFTESTYYDNGEINENFTIVLDLAETNIVINYDDVSLYMELHDSNEFNVRPTLYSTVKKFNIYSNVSGALTKAELNLTTNYSGNEIMFNTDSSTNISITSNIDYKYVDGFKIVDTTYENKEIGLAIKLVDINNNIVNKNYLKNTIFKIGSDTYYPDSDSIVRINLRNGISDISKDLTIITSENNGNLPEGIYYFKISNYVSDDGYYYDELSDVQLSIPVNVSENKDNRAYSFDVNMDAADYIISKNNEEVSVIFDILQSGVLNNPNIRVSLYKKDQLTAYNQSYSIVDLASHVSNNLNLFASNVYYISTNPVEHNNFELNLITDNFENTGYKFVFDLYDNTQKIGTIEKYFIVK